MVLDVNLTKEAKGHNAQEPKCFALEKKEREESL